MDSSLRNVTTVVTPHCSVASTQTFIQNKAKITTKNQKSELVPFPKTNVRSSRKISQPKMLDRTLYAAKVTTKEVRLYP